MANRGTSSTKKRNGRSKGPTPKGPTPKGPSPRTAQARRSEASPAEASPAEASPAKASPAKASPAKARSSKASPAKASPAKAGSADELPDPRTVKPGRFTPKASAAATGPKAGRAGTEPRASADPKAATGPKASKARSNHPPVPSDRYTPPIPRSQKSSPPWVPALLLSLLILGALVIICDYLGVLPYSPTSWYLLVGLVLVAGGFGVATQYR
ncbi:MAG: cell division protein CrgA [Acidimicrobiales bacterium]